MSNRKLFQAAILLGVFALTAPAVLDLNAAPKHAAAPIAAPKAKGADDIEVSWRMPTELNESGGGAPSATPEQAERFAWQEFIALNWPTSPGIPGREQSAGAFCPFGSTKCGDTPLVWETMRSKVETFPGDNNPPPGYTSTPPNYGYDAPPAYHYGIGVVDGPCDASQANDSTPWINLDETDQITLANMYAGVLPSAPTPENSAPNLIRFLAKSNRTQFGYVAAHGAPGNPNSWWNVIPKSVNDRTNAYIAAHRASPPPGSMDMVSLPNGTVEVKAGWRPLTAAEARSGRFHIQRVRYYEKGRTKYSVCWRNANWGLVALHIIQKTPSAPYFIYATFEQADNLLDGSTGKPVEDENGNIIHRQAYSTLPRVCLNDPRPEQTGGPGDSPSQAGQVILISNETTTCPALVLIHCASSGEGLYYENAAAPSYNPENGEPSGIKMCVFQRNNPIPADVIAANVAAHKAIDDYIESRPVGLTDTPWLYYKLVNVQYYPFTKPIPAPLTPNGSLYAGAEPYSATHPSPASYYLANIVVETNRSLQQFSGGLSPQIATDWNTDGSQHTNMFYGIHTENNGQDTTMGQAYSMGGCMGCHGSQGQNPGTNPSGDFSVILSRGAVIYPEIPSIETKKGLSTVSRNRGLSR